MKYFRRPLHFVYLVLLFGASWAGVSAFPYSYVLPVRSVQGIFAPISIDGGYVTVETLGTLAASNFIGGTYQLTSAAGTRDISIPHQAIVTVEGGAAASDLAFLTVTVGGGTTPTEFSIQAPLGGGGFEYKSGPPTEETLYAQSPLPDVGSTNFGTTELSLAYPRKLAADCGGPYAVDLGSKLTFVGASTALDGILLYSWSLDGNCGTLSSSTVEMPIFTPTNAGSCTVNLAIVDNDGVYDVTSATDSTSCMVTVSSAPSEEPAECEGFFLVCWIQNVWAFIVSIFNR